ncbi:hypothetical protein AnigIFM60653_004168 [Aspergillus niger]|uniref:Probable aspartic-type endopeptidase OPSB n=5 Tax=Aspergillus TaxID=5052 RepID=E2PT33_ASPNC|nr:uncharacterized protein An18g01320 [Aspergillus niger]XP_026627773.1 acid protease [Aspergillus welwitschiae]RDH24891.1 acid protease [Aspergillus niger ATCC 13496]RDH34751.1 acid protease [Aspergillus welwitschiae]CAK47205.1 unnamed protein product [Aspergillus niger]GKZ56551.1 hypothetical protein AnigIFM49718_001804 [Aspergillus niger]GKZ72016.1 hypothetical protein AnigIFM50267_008068 [Aspergillus niger]|eukprot:XP_001398592.1 aspartic-type endopeptidase opsB [Aspergillus niger CBS 513.88]
MKSTTLLSLAWAAQSAYSLSIHERDEPATLQFNFERRQIADRSRRKRSTASADLVNLATNLGYTMNLTLGTPGQEVSVTLDTGSSDLWVNGANSSVCPCTDYGSYNSSASSTYTFVNDEFYIQYVDGSEATGDYVNDTLKFSNVTLTNFQFAVAYDGDSEEGVLGIGYASNEASQATVGGGEYTNFPEALVDQGAINWPAYSLWLDDLDEGKGTILFGGVNTAKYYGSLQTLPIVSIEDMYVEFAVNLTAVHLEKNGNSVSVNNSATQFPIPAVLDSGTALTYIPTSAAASIYEAVGAQYLSEYGYGVIECDVKDEDFTFLFDFGSFNMSVDISEMILEASSDMTDMNVCTFGLAVIENEALLGDTFLRSAYVVYDLGNNEISLAKANFNPGEDHVLEIGTGSDAVPKATGATATGAAATSTASSDKSDKESSATVPRSQIVSLVAGVLVGVFLVL